MTISIKSVTLGVVAFPTTTGTVTTSETPSATQVGDLVVVINSGNWDALADMSTPTATGSPTVIAVSGGAADGGQDLAHVKSYTYIANTDGAQVINAAYSGSGFSDKALAAYVLSGADTTTPIDVAGATTSAAANEDPWVLASISPSTSDAFLIAALVRGGISGTNGGHGTPGSMTEQYDQGDTAPNAVGATEQLASSGATGTRSFDAGITGRPWSGVLIAVRTATVRYAMLRPAVVAR